MLYQHSKTTSVSRVADRLWHALAFLLANLMEQRSDARSLDNLSAADLKDIGLRRRPDGGTYRHFEL